MIEVDELAPEQSAEAWPVMAQLRPHLDEAGFLSAVERMRQTEGFRLAVARDDGRIVGVAGFRRMEMLYCGVILSVDDLVVDSAARSGGVGTALVQWLCAEARRIGAVQVHLDSSRQRLDAHRFYRREGFEDFALHFRRDL